MRIEQLNDRFSHLGDLIVRVLPIAGLAAAIFMTVALLVAKLVTE